jgi:hypothetical protein
VKGIRVRRRLLEASDFATVRTVLGDAS